MVVKFEILKFLGARRFGLRTAATEFLNFTPAPCNGFRNLKFTSVPRNRFEILKFTRASARLADTAQNFISQRGFKILKFTQELPFAPRRVLPNADKAEAGRGCSIAEKRRAVKLTYAGGYLNSTRRHIVRLYSTAVRHGYEAGCAEKFSKFDFTSALLNFISLPPRKFKPALLKFSPEVPRDRYEILNFTSKLSDGSEILKFTPELRKFKPTPAVRLNFALNSVPHASAVKFENGVKFKGAAKFKRSAR
ncbi:hypothetical protein [uncultured Campylobacter sp.]|uniref:hypothetical protein n=1 Tax=uncultured Campylobacter sp. TaxID=218934 RepID=UPI0026300130|nr:hypothetical protein [uncultured Campylobacter sp.]